ncbi:MAG: hypothetical protein QUS33_05960 [Dehalococcoidia bacterium]|nr:hypothetical protein [Dehalococcoidia bacterium]
MYKDKKGSLFFKRFGKVFGLDMTLYNEARSSFCRGLEIIDYNTDALLPYGGLHAASVFQTVDYLRSPENNYRRLSALPNLQMMTLVSKPLSEAADIVYRYVDVERKPGMTDDEYKNLVEAEAQELLGEVRRAQEELRSLPVLHGVFNWNVIAQVMNTQLDVKWAQDMESEIRNETINEEKVMRSRMNWAIIVVAIIIAGGIAGLLILSQLH